LTPPPEVFEREYGCTVADWLRCLPGAATPHGLQIGADTARICIGVGTGELVLRWTVLPPRRIALVTLPRLQVGFQFDGLDAPARESFMRRFDLFMHRGGG
jgi:hypothetical protein